MNWFCAQIGAREHYAIPRALQQTGRSVTLYTDFWAGPVVRQIAASKLRPLAARWHPDLGVGGRTTIKSWNLRTMFWEKKRRKISSARTPYHGFIEVGHRFAVQIRGELKRARPLAADAIVFAYDTGALEAFEWCREHGIKCVLNQMDPNRVEVELVRAEEKRWPGWVSQTTEVPEAYFKRREKEWALADRIVVNSEWSRTALMQQGVPSEKLVVIPLCYELKADRRHQTAETGNKFQLSAFSVSASSPLRVLFLGQVILRKGIQYLMAAAKRLEKENIQFDVVGQVGISQEAMATAPGNLKFHGRAGRDRAMDWYRHADVFVLPTLSDGFALTQLEAMSYGLPVIATPCCGDVVTNGVDGFIIRPRDAEALAEAILHYSTEPGLLRRHQTAALEKAKQFSLDHLAANLLKLESTLRNQ